QGAFQGLAEIGEKRARNCENTNGNLLDLASCSYRAGPCDCNQPFALRRLPGLPETNIKCKAAVLITHPADGESRRGLVLEFDDLALRGGSVSRKCDEQIRCHSLLDGHARGGIGLVAAKNGVDRKP